MKTPAKMLIVPELRMRDGHVIRTLADAIALLREHEVRPGVDARDEVLHQIERAHDEVECQQATQAFIGWARELDLLVEPLQTTHLQA